MEKTEKQKAIKKIEKKKKKIYMTLLMQLQLIQTFNYNEATSPYDLETIGYNNDTSVTDLVPV